MCLVALAHADFTETTQKQNVLSAGESRPTCNKPLVTNQSISNLICPFHGYGYGSVSPEHVVTLTVFPGRLCLAYSITDGTLIAHEL